MPEKVCIVSTVRAPLKQTFSFINYHLNIGIDELLLYFDDPADDAIPILARSERVCAQICDEAYWKARGVSRPASIEERQEINVNHGLGAARARGIDWLIHTDSDELLMSNGATVNAVLASLSADVVRFAMKEAASQALFYEDIFSTTTFKEPINDRQGWRPHLARLLGCGGAFFEGEYFRGHSASKVAIRTSSRVQYMGIHGPASPSLEECATSGIVLLHYDCVGFDDWLRKWNARADATGAAARMRPNRVRQFTLFKRARGNVQLQRNLFSRIHRLNNPYQRFVLHALGLLSTVRLDRTLFTDYSTLNRRKFSR